MANIGIYYGTTAGNTEDVAKEIAKKLNVSASDLHDVAKAGTDFSKYDVILFGSSSYGMGDLQDDWESYIEKLKEVDLSGKKVALFGCGDSSSYSDTFCNAVGKIYESIKNNGAQFIGQVSTDGYTYDESESVINGKFIGLVLDQDNEYDLTSERIDNWIAELEKNF